MNTITARDKLKCAERELAMRKSAYPKWIAQKRLSPAAAAHEIATMAAIVEDYKLIASYGIVKPTGPVNDDV